MITIRPARTDTNRDGVPEVRVELDRKTAEELREQSDELLSACGGPVSPKQARAIRKEVQIALKRARREKKVH